MSFRTELIKNTYYGSITIVGTAGPGTSQDQVITTINPDNSIIFHLGESGSPAADQNGNGSSVKIKDATHITGWIGGVINTGSDLITIYYLIIEFYDNVVENVKSGFITITAGLTSGSASVTVGTKKGTLIPAFHSFSAQSAYVRLSISGSTVSAIIALADGLTNPYTGSDMLIGYNYLEM